MPWRREWHPLQCSWASLVAQMVKNLPAMQEIQVQPLSWEDPRRREWQPTPVFLPRESHGQRNLAGYSPWGFKESEQLSDKRFHFHFPVFLPEKSLGQRSLEGYTIYAVPKSQTQLSAHTHGRADVHGSAPFCQQSGSDSGLTPMEQQPCSRRLRARRVHEPHLSCAQLCVLGRVIHSCTSAS